MTFGWKLRPHSWYHSGTFFPALVLVLAFISRLSWAGEIHLQNEHILIQCDPARLALTLTPTGRPAMEISAPFTNEAAIADLRQTSTEASWQLLEPLTTIQLTLETNGALITFTAGQSGRLAWPRMIPDAGARGWILPMFEGVYVSLTQTNSAWRTELLQPGTTLDTTADLTLPLWGLDEGDCTLTCLLQNPFNNQLHFTEAGGRMALEFEHEFTRNQKVKACGFRFIVGAASPIQPALEYRRQLQAAGEFISLEDKIKQTPEVGKLIGAAQAYLWGDGTLGIQDVEDWKGLAGALKDAGQDADLALCRHWWSMLDQDAQNSAAEIAGAPSPDHYHKSVLVRGLNQALAATNFYDPSAGLDVVLNAESRDLLQHGAASLSSAELCRLNADVLFAVLGRYFKPESTWGEGVSPPMIRELSAAGFDRLWLGAEGWSGFVKRPDTVKTARDLGYLIGPYDSYASIHPPGLPADQTWPTAQFDAGLYRTGAVINADGKPRPGFLQRGYKLSTIAARPWVERRVAGLMKLFPANSWFMDCDGFGDFLDDYSPVHPMTQATDQAARAARCAWLSDTYRAVIGSEGCSAGLAATLHFSNGVLTPVIGWGDADLSRHTSKYWLGGYFPPEEPPGFFKPVPLKEKYHRLYYDASNRLPLFEAVFHDSVVATHHWSSPSLKFPEVAGTVELLELLYNVPPLYHLSRPEFARIKPLMKRHYDFFSPLHRELACLPLTSFRWLTDDKMVQTAEFGGKVAITANFGGQAFTNAVVQLPAQSVVVRWLAGGGEPVRYQVVPGAG